jgi:hypothetical protein
MRIWTINTLQLMDWQSRTSCVICSGVFSPLLNPSTHNARYSVSGSAIGVGRGVKVGLGDGVGGRAVAGRSSVGKMTRGAGEGSVMGAQDERMKSVESRE